MAKRVFEIAKELGVKSKAIVDKCVAEGIPDIQNHMSSVKAGLEATVREWFSVSTDHESTTAVETADPVKLEEVRLERKTKARSDTGHVRRRLGADGWLFDDGCDR